MPRGYISPGCTCAVHAFFAIGKGGKTADLLTALGIAGGAEVATVRHQSKGSL
jgi:hypothetical protein